MYRYASYKFLYDDNKLFSITQSIKIVIAYEIVLIFMSILFHILYKIYHVFMKRKNLLFVHCLVDVFGPYQIFNAIFSSHLLQVPKGLES